MKRAGSFTGAIGALYFSFAPSAQAQQEAAGSRAAVPHIWVCGNERKAVFISNLEASTIEREWLEFEGKESRSSPGSQCINKSKPILYAFVYEEYVEHLRGSYRGQLIEWTPTGRNSVSSDRRTKSVFFKSPSGTQKGYSGVKFDIEYQFIVCDREVHLAYSVVPDSARVHNGGIPTYWWGGPDKYRFHKSNLSLPSINSLPLKIVVWKGDAYASALARLSDVQASKALGFGCFTGQSQKVGLLKDHISDSAPEKIKAVLNTFNASFETSYILTNAAAEDEIRNAAGKLATDPDQDPSVGIASIQNDDTPGPDQAAKALNEANLLKAKAAVDALAANAAKFRADQETYERGVREAAAAKARFDQSMAAYELELARTQAAQAEYQRKMADHRKATGGR